MSRQRWIGFLPAALIAVACTDAGPTTPSAGTEGPDFDFIPGGEPITITDPVADPLQLGERFIICKDGPAASFDVYEEETLLGTVEVADGECRIVFQTQGETRTIRSMEIVPADATLDRVLKTQLTCGNDIGVECDPATSPVVEGPTEVSDPVSGFVGGSGTSANPSQKGFSGVLVEYFNSPAQTDGVGEGCTPGYWKQPHHFDSWPDPYDPDDLFSDYFEDAYPGSTLLEVLELQGNQTGLEALGRHTVAALLNAAALDFDLTEADVIDAFNDVFPGTKQEYNELKADFEGFNQRSCPLN